MITSANNTTDSFIDSINAGTRSRHSDAMSSGADISPSTKNDCRAMNSGEDPSMNVDSIPTAPGCAADAQPPLRRHELRRRHLGVD